MCAHRCAGSFFKDSIDASVNERPPSIKHIVKNASTPIQIAPTARVAFWGVSGIFLDRCSHPIVASTLFLYRLRNWSTRAGILPESFRSKNFHSLNVIALLAMFAAWRTNFGHVLAAKISSNYSLANRHFCAPQHSRAESYIYLT